MLNLLPLSSPACRGSLCMTHTPDAHLLGGGFARKCLSGHGKCRVTSEKARVTLCNTPCTIKALRTRSSPSSAPARVSLPGVEGTPLGVWAYNTHLAVRCACASTRNSAQYRPDTRRYANAREIARMCTLGRLGGVAGLAVAVPGAVRSATATRASRRSEECSPAGGLPHRADGACG